MGYNGNCNVIYEKLLELGSIIVAGLPKGDYTQTLDYSIPEKTEVREWLRDKTFMTRLDQSFPTGLSPKMLG